jgi:NCAIR mutase (PurE)-related protein
MRQPPVADLGFAQLDLARAARCGFPEVVYSEGKRPDDLAAIVATLQGAGQDCLATRVSDAQAARLAEEFPRGEQDRIGRTFWLPAPAAPTSGPAPRAPRGQVLIVTAGTADLPVAREALATVHAFGCNAELIVDVGVAGLHRLTNQLERLRQADVLIVIAGMEAALASVVGGLVACPVIAVPTSVGYGAHFDGLTALLGMLNSCAANVAVVNIDAGFKAGYVAGLMLRRLKPADG